MEETTAPIKIVTAAGSSFAELRALFLEYAESLDFSLCFQGFDHEVGEIESVYGPPNGTGLLAKDGQASVGCAGVKRASESSAEMKRVYVVPKYRGLGIGRKLVEKCIESARRLGYQRLWLSTMPSMKAAAELYEILGFVGVEPQDDMYIEGIRYMEIRL